jgi:hypothetical protein
MKASLFTLTFTVMFALSATTLHAAVISSYSFTGGSAASSDTEPNSTSGNMTEDQASWGFSATTHNAYAFSQAMTNSEADAISGGDYFSFIVTPDSFYAMNLLSLNFDTAYNVGTNQSNGSPTASYFVRSSVDGFDANVGDTFNDPYNNVSNADDTMVARSVDLSGAAFQDLTTATEFRIFIYTSSADSGLAARIDNVVLNGNVQLVPAPAAWPAGLGLLSLMGLRRRRSV